MWLRTAPVISQTKILFLPALACIDAGEQSSNYTNEPLFNGGRVNMGAYGNTIYASKSPCKIKNTLTN